jgi:hypothetical protein
MKPQRLLILAAVVFAVAGCDPLALGYVNQLSHPVTIVEQGRAYAQPMRLASGESRPPSFGTTAKSIDILDGHGRLLAHYRTRDIPRGGGRGSVQYVVITPHGAEMELKEHLAYDE